jgi:hypothetical protein
MAEFNRAAVRKLLIGGCRTASLVFFARSPVRRKPRHSAQIAQSPEQEYSAYFKGHAGGRPGRALKK